MLVSKMFQNRCPNCGKGLVYDGKNLATFGSLKMHDQCPYCHSDFRKDPGFYWGAMYVSYAMAFAEAFIVYLACRFSGKEAFDIFNLVAIVVAILICSPFNFRFSRLAWLYIFPKG